VRTSIVALAAVVALGGGALLWTSEKPAVRAPVAKRTELPPHALPARREVNPQAVAAYKRARLARPTPFDEWVDRADVSPEQAAQALQLLADAQAIYDETGDLRAELRDKAKRMRDARMTLEQRLRHKAAVHRMVLTEPRQSDEELIAASKDLAELSSNLDEALEATAPAAERAAFAFADQVTNDLEAQVLAGFATFLTPRQIEAFQALNDPLPMLLEESYRNRQPAAPLSASTSP
jgi:hypothetical protein